MRKDVPHRMVFDLCQQVFHLLAVRDFATVEQSSKVLTLVAELRASRAFVSALGCLCSRRLPDRAVDSEFGSAPCCVEKSKCGAERGRICKWSLPAHASPSYRPQSSSSSRFTA